MIEITYRNTDVELYCTNLRKTQKEYGSKLAMKLSQRLDDLQSLNTVYELLSCGIDNPHLLNYDLDGCIGWDLTSNVRLIIRISDSFTNDIIEQCKYMTTVCIEGVRDYHGGNKKWLIN